MCLHRTWGRKKQKGEGIQRLISETGSSCSVLNYREEGGDGAEASLASEPSTTAVTANEGKKTKKKKKDYSDD